MHLKRKLRDYEGIVVKDLILGGQDGLVDVLGVILGVATATANIKLVIIAALSSAIAESFSMGAVAYTSQKALEEYSRKRKDSLRYIKAFFESLVVFLSTLIGSLIPIIPFLVFNLNEAIIVALILSLLVLFVAGALSGKIAKSEHWIRSGLRILLIGAGAAFVGYLAGLWLQNL